MTSCCSSRTRFNLSDIFYNPLITEIGKIKGSKIYYILGDSLKISPSMIIRATGDYQLLATKRGFLPEVLGVLADNISTEEIKELSRKFFNQTWSAKVEAEEDGSALDEEYYNKQAATALMILASIKSIHDTKDVTPSSGPLVLEGEPY